MSEDRSLFGEGRYPETGPLAILARLGFLLSPLAIIAAVVLPPWVAPHFARSHYLEHFAAFYVATLCGMAAMPRTRLRRIGTGYLIFAALLEAAHIVVGAPLRPLLDNWAADVGGTATALTPVVIERFRRRCMAPASAGN